MALTPLRWLAAVVAGCLLLVTIVQTVGPRPRSPVDNRASAAYDRTQLWERAGIAAARRLRTTRLVDSLERALARAPSGGASRIIIDPRIGKQDAFRVTVSERIRSGVNAGAPIDVVVLLDTATKVGVMTTYSFNKVTHVLPSAPGQRCMALGRFTGTETARRFSLYSGHVISEILGPCDFYAAFGMPGAGINAWLRRDGVAFAIHSRGQSQRLITPGQWIETSTGWWLLKAGFGIRALVSEAAYACISGDAGECETQVLKPQVFSRRLGLGHVEPDGSITRAMIEDELWAIGALGPASSDLLSDMSAMIGPDKFRSFWTSNQSPAEAFRSATGQELGDWLTEWATVRYGAAGRGPGVPVGASLVAVLVALVALGAATVASRRRQVV